MVTMSEPATGREIRVFRELRRTCLCVAFSPNGNRLAAASGDGTVQIWDATPLLGNEDPSLALNYPGEQIWALDIAPDGRSIAVAGKSLESLPNKSAPVLACSGLGFQTKRQIPGFSIIVFSVAYDPTGRFLAFSGDHRPRPPGGPLVKVWDLESDREAYSVEPFDGDQILFSVAFSGNGKWLVGGGGSTEIRVWNAATGRKVGLAGTHNSEVTKVVFSTDSRYLASMGHDDTVKLWDASRLGQAQDPRTFQAQCGGYADSIAFSPDSSRLAITTDDDTAKIHDLTATDRSIRCFQRGHRPLAVAFSPDGRWLASGGVDCAVKVWDAQTGKLLHTFKSHLGMVVRLKFLQRPEGLRLVSGSSDSTVKIWDLSPLEKQLTRP
jgi:WD40 repeat protein